LKKESEKEEKKDTSRSKKKKIAIAVGLALFIPLLGATFFFLYKKGEEIAREGVRIPKGVEVKKSKRELVKKEVKKSTVKVRKPKQVSFKVYRDVFKEFYTKKFIAEVKKEIEKELKKEYEAKLRVLKARNSPPSLEKLLFERIKVFAIVCTDKCYAYTNRGVIKDGEVVEGVRVRVTESGIHLGGRET